MNIILNILLKLISREYRIEIDKSIYEIKYFFIILVIINLDFR